MRIDFPAPSLVISLTFFRACDGVSDPSVDHILDARDQVPHLSGAKAPHLHAPRLSHAYFDNLPPKQPASVPATSRKEHTRGRTCALTITPTGQRVNVSIWSMCRCVDVSTCQSQSVNVSTYQRIEVPTYLHVTVPTRRRTDAPTCTADYSACAEGASDTLRGRA